MSPDAAWFATRTRELFGAREVALTGPDEHREGWVAEPVRDRAGEVLGLLQLRPGPRWNSEESAAALRITAASAVSVLAGSPEDGDSALGAALAMTEVALTSRDYATMVNGIGAAIAPVTDTARLGVALWNSARGYLQSLPRSFGADDAMAASSQVDPQDSRSGAARVWRTGRTVWSNDPAQTLPAQRDWIRAFGIRQLLSTPLVVGGQAFGVLHLANHREQLDEHVARAAESVAPFVAGCVSIVRQRTELHRNEAISDAVAAATTAIAMGRPLERVADETFLEFCRTAEVRRLAVTFAGERAPRILVSQDESGPAVAAWLERSFRDDARRHAPERESRLHRPEAAGDAGWSAVHHPVLAAGTAVATLSVLRVPGTPFSAEEEAALGRLANVVSLAVLTERYEQERADRERIQERQRIADDLHDRVAQAMFAGEVVLQSALEDLEPESAVHAAVAHARSLLVRSETSLRDAIHQLSAPESRVDLATRLRGTVLDVGHEFGIPIDLTVGRSAEERARDLAADTAETVLRAAREIMVNAAKHGGPDRIDVALRVQGDRLLVAVDDDGVGFSDGGHEGYGLRSARRSLHEVRGLLRIARRRPARVLISVPLPTTGSA
ncbi:GAF domain-containing sensor histidine kinase [Pseudonocardia halophobica]|uniref:sensor histidine kinase n=1 Tax=Pseudonocardia halophobica TaxID=29401 RepID=UPI003D90A653